MAAAYGRVPDPEEAYEKAVKAVEEAAAPVVSPKNSLTTLGTIIRDMKAQQDWAIDLPGRATDVAIPLAEALWSGQESARFAPCDAPKSKGDARKPAAECPVRDGRDGPSRRCPRAISVGQG
ncbi:hypothetical protein [Curtobacterium sp. MCPF17_031]|uniref:hypothetical protein n=1 Tax=Curtobacterium sp. MCPF17_031 TaxID=2175653 RepID=UPI0011B3C67E|nr:hypothetical protein [Curtobacterium sp. MCPF17_031]